MRKITKLIVHCSATPEGKDYSVDTIRDWHLKRGWSDIGYHFVIYRNGEVVEGRPIERTGAHCKGENYCSIGICYIGGVESEKQNGKWIPKDTRTPEQKDALDDLLCQLSELYPKSKVYGHCDFSSKACPSFDAKTEYEYLNM
ncbi:MAG: putative endolysin [Prokaryotic dsDNA virus sp.]|jgi:N-acetylmuramoyl-L-alanine amidase|nr:MAG: putative endolysin [Prokaryotic dsDNA virus sp.]|tara:strand:- start:2581 stop:3009 length:429 start_codon:yes stop_codon:yes gene_type:complete